MPCTERKSHLSERERERYKRQLMLQGFTLEHQERLRNSTALIAGIGGLGGTAALYLAVAGIGKMVLAHYGRLTQSNMNRQVLMRHDAIGKTRVEQAMRTIQEINPDVEVEIHDERSEEGNIEKLLEGVDIAISARPNFRERRVLNAACVKRGVMMVEAAMNGMEGYLFNVIPNWTPCLHCLYPADAPAWEELGFPVLGAVSGALGCFMAIEAIKLLTGYGKPMILQMLIFNTLDMDFRKVRVHRDEDCAICGGKSVAEARGCWAADAPRRSEAAFLAGTGR
jgi:molybdopterin/thiamine biosynthesis adenylyltransferase